MGLVTYLLPINVKEKAGESTRSQTDAWAETSEEQQSSRKDAEGD